MTTASGLVFGWPISHSEYKSMLMNCWDYEDNFICPDADWNNPTYIFGTWIYKIEPGTMIEFNLTDLAMRIPSDFLGEYRMKLRAMGRADIADMPPTLMLIGEKKYD